MNVAAPIALAVTQTMASAVPILLGPPIGPDKTLTASGASPKADSIHVPDVNVRQSPRSSLGITMVISAGTVTLQLTPIVMNATRSPVTDVTSRATGKKAAGMLKKAR